VSLKILLLSLTDGIISNIPTITIVSQSGIKMGNKAAKMLIDRLESEEDEERKLQNRGNRNPFDRKRIN
jgi:LacI family transcriptional regulator